MGLQLADALVSPTRYMTDFLKQRGWRLPATRLVIPNVVPPGQQGGPLGPALPGAAPAQAGSHSCIDGVVCVWCRAAIYVAGFLHCHVCRRNCR